LNEDNYELIMAFDNTIASYVSKLTNDAPSGTQDDANESSEVSTSVNNSLLGTLLGEESVDNLRLLFDIKMRLSVRLGTKICLLRDVISWDIGEIIELSQMTNEPLDILVNGNVIGKGEAVIVDGKFGVKIKSIGSKKIN